jgi:hypothetical protein
MSDDVAEPIEERATAVGKSPSADAAREPTKIAEPSTNAEIVQELRTRNRFSGPSTSDVVEAVRNSRR